MCTRVGNHLANSVQTIGDRLRNELRGGEKREIGTRQMPEEKREAEHEVKGGGVRYGLTI